MSRREMHGIVETLFVNSFGGLGLGLGSGVRVCGLGCGVGGLGFGVGSLGFVVEGFVVEG